MHGVNAMPGDVEDRDSDKAHSSSNPVRITDLLYNRGFKKDCSDM